MMPWPRGAARHRWVLGLAAGIAAAVACTDAAITGPIGQRVRAAFGLRAANVPVMQASNLPINNVRVRINLAGGGVLDTTVVYPGTDSIVLALTLQRDGETFPALIQYRSDTTTLFQTEGVVRARASNSTDTTTAPSLPAPVPTGPSVAATSIAISPRDTSIAMGDSMRFRSVARDAGGAVLASDRYVINWSTSDATSPIVGNGSFRAPARRITLRVVGSTPNGVKDSTTLTLVPVAVRALIDSGNAQSGSAGALLARPLVVRVLAADSLGVANVPVRVRALTATAQVTDSVVLTDANGRARTSLTLASTVGAVGYEARVGTLPVLAVSATAVAGAATRLVSVSGNGQSATVGAAVALAPTVRVTDQFGNQVTGSAVTFAVRGGGGTVAGGSATSNASGLAFPTSWTLGTTPGVNELIARLGTSDSVVFTATAQTGPAATVLKVSGDGQTATVASAPAQRLLVRVRDALGNSVAGVPVRFRAQTAGALVQPSFDTVTVLSDAAGEAGIVPTLRQQVGANVFDVNVGALPAVTFTLQGTAGAAARLAAPSGNGQSATVGTPVGLPISVRVVDAFGNAIAGASVSYAVTSGGGSVVGSLATSNAAGDAALTSWTLGTAPGVNTLLARLGTLDSLLFTATALTGSSASLLKVSGDGQSATVASAPAQRIIVRLLDALGNSVSGVSVRFRAQTAGALTQPGFDTVTVLTDAAGEAGIFPTLRQQVGANVFEVTAGVLSPVSFTLQGLAGAAARLTAPSGDGQSAPVGTAVASPVSVRVVDAFGNAVAGASVQYAVQTGGGSVIGSPVTSTVTGDAPLPTWTLGTVPGANTLIARLALLDSASFTATATTGPAAKLVKVVGDVQTAEAGTAVPIIPQVRVTDTFGNTVGASAATVSFAVTLGGGTVVGGDAVATNSGGLAAPTSWTLGANAGENRLIARLGTLDSAIFTATAQVTAASSIVLQDGNGQSATVGTLAANPLVVRTLDGQGAPLAGIRVLFRAVTAGAQVSNGLDTVTVLTDAGGTASSTARVAALVGPNTFTATTGTLPAVSFTIAGTVGAPVTLGIVGTSNGTDTVYRVVALQPQVEVVDGLGNRVPGVVVRYQTPSIRSGTVSIDTVTTDALGRAALRGTWRLDSLVGVDTLIADIPAQGSVLPQRFIWTSVAALPTRLLLDSGAFQTARRNEILPKPLVLRVTDTYFNPVGGRTVSYVAQPYPEGGLAVQTGIVTSLADGRVRFDSIRGPDEGTNLNVLFASDYSRYAAAFLYVAGSPFSLVADSGDGQSAPAGTLPAVVPRFSVYDENGVPIPGATVNVAHTYPDTSGGRQTTSTRVFTVVSNDSGYVRLTGWNLGPLPGTNTVTVSLGSVSATLLANGTGIGSPTAVNSIVAVGAGRLIRSAGSTVSGVQLQTVNAFGAALATQTITLSRLDPSSGNVFPMGTVVTDATGVATVPAFALSATPGRTRLLATMSNAAPYTLPIDAPGLPTYLAQQGEASASYYIGSFSTIPSAKALLLDENGVPVAGRTVSWTMTQPSASGGAGGNIAFRTGSATSDSAGLVTVPWQYDSARLGTYVMTMTFGSARTTFSLALYSF